MSPVGSGHDDRKLRVTGAFSCVPPSRSCFSAAASAASAQVIPTMAAPFNLSGFGTITTVKPALGYYSDAAVYGITLGGFIQRRPLIGVELRGELLRSGGIEHEEALLTGPRFAPHFEIFSLCVRPRGRG